VINGWWKAIAVIPGPETDLDLRLHEHLQGVKNGFRSNLTTSSWDMEESDYVLVNFNETSLRHFDVGVLSVQDVSAYYWAHAERSYFLDHNPSGGYGPYTMASGEIIHLHECNFSSAGMYALSLENVSGTVDWGITLHAAVLAYQDKLDSVSGGIAWMNGPGEGESIGVDIGSPGYYCLAVWKRGTDDAFEEGTYRIHALPGATPVPETADLPEKTRLTTLHPNPFNPRLNIGFELAVAAPVQIAIFDLRGRLVRTLLEEPRQPGNHEVLWDGTDEDGRKVSSGVYVVGLTTPELRQTSKVVLAR
jgi:hypothetical protein